MKHLKQFEAISEDDIIKCIEQDINIYVDNIKDLPEHNKSTPLRVINTDGNEVTVEISGKYYDVDINDVIRMDINRLQRFENYNLK